MDPLRVLTASEQVAEHLRGELLRGVWSETMPGEDRLVAQLGVGRDTVKMALRHLEHEGLLVSQGVGRRRRIQLPKGHTPVALRVAILSFDQNMRREDFAIELCHMLEKFGYAPFFTDKTLYELGRDVDRVARFVQETEADAWIVTSGSREVLNWFAEQQTPAFALYGARHGLPVAGTGPDKSTAIAEATRRLIALGHRRISFLSRRDVRQPKPVKALQIFLNELETAGINTGAFNLPDWEESGAGFELILDSLFSATPPTALILDEPFLFNACFHYLAGRGMQVPQDVSLVCTDGDSGFDWCRPTVAHLRWDYRPVLRRVVRWVNNVGHGKEDRRQSSTKAEFVDGGTVGPAL